MDHLLHRERILKMASPEVELLQEQVAILQAQVAALEAWRAAHVVLNNAVCEVIYLASRKHWRPGSLLILRKQLEVLCEPVMPPNMLKNNKQKQPQEAEKALP